MLRDFAHVADSRRGRDQRTRRLGKWTNRKGPRVVVAVDDGDRLPASGASDLIGLIGELSRFPNIVILACYDPHSLAVMLESAAHVPDGERHLAAFVDARIPVPQPEYLALRSWLVPECKTILDASGTAAETLDARNGALAQLLYGPQSRHLRMPRDVADIAATLRFMWPPIAADACFEDAVWLAMLRARSPRLYRWVEDYMVRAASVLEGASIAEGERRAFAGRLDAILGEESLFDAVAGLAEVLPGFAPEPGGSKPGLFRFDSDQVKRFAAGRRIGSPRHYRFYFALAAPSGRLSEREIGRFVALAEAGGDVGGVFRHYAAAQRLQGGTLAGVLVERLVDWPLPPAAAAPIIACLAGCMDIAALSAAASGGQSEHCWEAGRRLLRTLLRLLQGQARRTAIDSLAEGSAAAWVAGLLRLEKLAAAGRTARTAGGEPMLAPAECDAIQNALVRRLDGRGHSPPVRPLLEALFAWGGLGQAGAVERWFDGPAAEQSWIVPFFAAQARTEASAPVIVAFGASHVDANSVPWTGRETAP